MPKVHVSSAGFDVTVIDEPYELVLYEINEVSKSADGVVPVIISQSDVSLNTVINVEDSVYGTTYIQNKEEIVPNYSIRKDFIGENIIITGEAPIGSSEASPVWRISRIEFINQEGDIVETWAEGNDNFDKIWVDRLTYTYQ